MHVTELIRPEWLSECAGLYVCMYVCALARLGMQEFNIILNGPSHNPNGPSLNPKPNINPNVTKSLNPNYPSLNPDINHNPNVTSINSNDPHLNPKPNLKRNGPSQISI
jgi:hypothetical protein